MELRELYAAEQRRIAGLAAQGDLLHPVFGEGPLPAPLMLIGEAPGREEAASGRPFVGKAGKTLNELLQKAGIGREHVFVTNAVKYRPMQPQGNANRTPGAKEICGGLTLFSEELLAVRPRIVATLGNAPLRAIFALLGEAPATIGALHGQALPFELAGLKSTLCPLYHPASVIYNPALRAALEQDLITLGELYKAR
ncbi:MAG: uracil-DNA glycosylase [Christensenellaceae bacterium]|jgi:DNA polymerase|nr:uracil-DNA glycosylase [Christensenellaceae bacterium]